MGVERVDYYSDEEFRQAQQMEEQQEYDYRAGLEAQAMEEERLNNEMQKLKVIDLENVNRLVVVHWVKPSKMGMKGTGRVIDQWNAHVELSLQDEGRTLKVFYGENK